MTLKECKDALLRNDKVFGYIAAPSSSSASYSSTTTTTTNTTSTTLNKSYSYKNVRISELMTNMYTGKVLRGDDKVLKVP